jgi:hypothetical protein
MKLNPKKLREIEQAKIEFDRMVDSFDYPTASVFNKMQYSGNDQYNIDPKSFLGKVCRKLIDPYYYY